MKTYYMFGDSLMRGVMPDEAWNYHSSDAIGFEKMQAQYNMKFLNFAMPTFTSERVKMWLTQIMSSHPVPDAAFLECGGNDCDYDWKSICEGLDNGRISRMNGTDYVLVEFMPSDPYQYIRNSLDEIMSEGYQPVIAHVERYGCIVDDIENVRGLSRMGVEIQVNASSITGDTGKEIKKFVHKLLKEQLVDYVGTDAHRCEDSRTPMMKECSRMLYKKYDERYVDSILYGNAFDRLLADTNN